ncbi:MAG: hypothetical protein IPK82_06005 [Polyangiaceae bacterium]|nr:hypothetical protein [Polyangiaceae bacterium]
MIAQQANSLCVEIIYRLRGDPTWHAHRVNPVDYFEPAGPEGHLEVDSVPRYDHAVQFLQLDTKEVDIVRVVIDSPGIKRRTITETFWHGGTCRAIERQDSGITVDWEMILEVLVCDHPPTWNIVRLIRADGIVVPVYHGVITKNEDGSESELSFQT